VEGLTGAGFVKADANGLLSVDTAAYTVVTGATNYLTKITAPNTLGQSLVYDNGTSVYVNSTTGVTGYNHSFTVVANTAGGMVVSTTNTASAIGIVNSASGNKTWDISPFNNTLVINESGLATRMVFHPGGNITIGDITTTGHKLEIVGSFRTTGNNTLSQLQGVGNRMVVADTNGLLSTQAIPSSTGSVTSVSGTGGYGGLTLTGTVTTSGSLTLGGTPTGTWPISVTGNAATVTIANTNVNASYYIPLVSSTGNMSLLIDGGNDLNYNPFTNVFTIGGSIVINSVVINGGTASQFMKANGTLDNNTYLTGTGTAGQVTYWTGASAQSGSNNLFWDNTNGRLGVGITTPLQKLHIVDGAIQLTDSYPIRWGTSNLLYGSTTALDIANTAFAVRFRFTTGGNLLINSTTDSGERLQVTGTMKVTGNMTIGETATASTITLPQTSGYTDFIVTNNGTASTGIRFRNTAGTRAITIGGTNMDLSNPQGSIFALTISSQQITLGSPTNTSIRGFNLATLDLNGNDTQLYARTNVQSVLRLLSGSLTSTAKGTVYISDYTNVAVSPNASAQLQVDSTVQGFLQPRLTTVQRDAIASPATGLSVYNTTTNTNNTYNGTSWISEGNVGGSGISGQVAYWNGTTSQTGSNNLFWDNTNGRLGIGTNAPANDFDLTKTSATDVTAKVRNLNSGGYSTVSIVNDLGQTANYSIFGSTYVTASLRNRAFLTSEATNGFGFSLFNNSSTADFSIFSTTSLTERFRLFGSTGNVLIQNGGTFTDAGFRLDVNGTARVQGTLRVNQIFFGTNGQGSYLFPHSGQAAVADNAGLNLTLYNYRTSLTPQGAWAFAGELINATSGSEVGIRYQKGFSPASGTATHTALEFVHTINQQGAASGVTRAIYINPSIVVASDFRAIEWGNNTGRGLYGIGTAANYLGGALTVNNQITAGNAQATAGSVVLRSTYSSGNISNIGTNGSSGGISISYGAYPASTSTADAFLSGVGTVSFPRSSYIVQADHRWLSAADAIVAEGSAVTLTEKMRLYNSGNLVIQNGGTYADSGERLQVTGAMKVTGNVAVDTNVLFIDTTNDRVGIGTASPTRLLDVAGSGQISTLLTNTISPISGTITISSTTNRVEVNATNFDGYAFAILNGTNTRGTGGTQGSFSTTHQYAPTSGSLQYNGLNIANTINQTGGANGITRGLYINPTLTAAADWRSIEWSNNSGYGLYGAGTAQNLLNGKLTVNVTVPTGAFANANTMGVFGSQVLNIPTGTQGVAGAVYAANSGFHYFRFNGNTTLVGDALWAASVSVANFQFDTAGTITMPDGAGGGSRPRALSGLQIQMQSAGNNNGTISRAAGILIQGCYPSTGTGVTTFTDFAGIRINDLTEWGTARITMTNRWGIYQAGADDRNYFNGSMLLGSATSTGERLQVTGTMKVTGATTISSTVKLSGLPTSATGLTAGDIWNNAGVLNIV
jgi:hypothetical protein